MRERPRTQSFIQLKCFRERAVELWHFTKLMQSKSGGVELGNTNCNRRELLKAGAGCSHLGNMQSKGTLGWMAEEPQALWSHLHPSHHGTGRVGACGQDQPRGSRSPATRPTLKCCKSRRQKLLTHMVEKIKSVLLLIFNPPGSLGLGFPPWFVTVHWKYQICCGKRKLCQHPEPSLCRRACKRAGGSSETLQTLLFSPAAVPLQEPEGSWGQVGAGGGSPPGGWWGRRGLATEQRYVHEGLDGHAAFAAGMCLGSTFQPTTS